VHRRQFLAAAAAGLLMPADKAFARGPLMVPDPLIRDRVASARGQFGFEKVELISGKFSKLPESDVRRIAWTVDDGASTDGVKDYLDFVEQYDLRMTFFINSVYPAWAKNKDQLQALVGAGRVQLANHTHSHHYLTKLSSEKIRSELTRCGNFIEDNFGVPAGPYLRPPYGRIDNRVMSIAQELGYSSVVMWSGSLGDTAMQRKQNILIQGKKWIQDGIILLDHFNSRTPENVFKQLATLLDERGLQTVTLDDVFY
jgi:peptidoglycan/xylan/chitin deacetylase (PgdA/CDA1 family)